MIDVVYYAVRALKSRLEVGSFVRGARRVGSRSEDKLGAAEKRACNKSFDPRAAAEGSCRACVFVLGVEGKIIRFDFIRYSLPTVEEEPREYDDCCTLPLCSCEFIIVNERKKKKKKRRTKKKKKR